MSFEYLIRRADFSSSDRDNWNAPLWNSIEPLEVSQFHPRSSDHHPHTRVRLLHDGRQVHIRFDVDDRFVISQATEFQQSVCLDSCVEFFFLPRRDRGYFNLEINCGGTLLLHYVEDHTRIETGLKKWQPVTAEHARSISIYHSLPGTVFPERSEPASWRIGCRFPLSVIEPYIGPLSNLAGQEWKGNFYKCADRSSHPHWASWVPIGEKLNFHQPQFFGRIRFE